MDFTPSAAAAAVAEVTQEVVGRLEPDWTDKFTAHAYDRTAWRALVDAGLTVLALPEDHGGDALGSDALVPLVVGAGRAAAVTPLIGTLAAGTILAGHSAAAQRWAPAIASGGWCAVAAGERGAALGESPQICLTGDSGSRRLTGRKTGVAFAAGASALLVTVDGGCVVVDPQADGVSMHRTPTSTGAGEYTVNFDRVVVGADDFLPEDNLTGPGTPALIDVYRALVGAYADGLLAGAMAMTASHVIGREQFGRPIAAFQAVGQQLADVYVVSRTLNLIVTSAAWRVANGRDAQHDLATATYWMAAELPAAMRTMTHLHGGIGVDLTYPLHRYFSLAKDLARLAGGADQALEVLA